MPRKAAPAQIQVRLSHWFKDELNAPQLIASLNAALILFLLEIIVVLSLTALIYSGDLAARLPDAISFVLLGDAIIVATVSLLSSYGGSIAVMQDTPGVVLALATAAMVASLPAGLAAGDLFPTVILLIVITTVVMGFVYLLLGIFKLGGLVRFIPYPVMGGFLAGTGWLLVVGGIGVATGSSFGAGLLQPALLARMLPALGLGLFMLLVVMRRQSPLALAGIFAVVLVLFYAVVWLVGIPLSTLAAQGWLLGSFPQDLTWRFPLSSPILSNVHWPALLSALPVAAPAIVISVIAFLLNASGLELVVKRDITLNRELIATGVANLAAGLAGGLIGYSAISFSTLNHTLGKGKRLPGLLVAVLLLMTLFLGATLLSLIPRLLLGGLLIYIGLALLYEWVIQAWSTFPRIDYAIVLSILVIIATQGFLWGIGLGLIMTVLLFVVSYSRIDIVRYELSGTTYRSRVNRSPGESKVLQAHGDQLLILKLQGFIFFGTANSLFERVRERIQPGTGSLVRFILLDFEQVSGLDSTGLLSFRKLLQFTRENNSVLMLSGLAGRARDQLLKGGFTAEADGLRLFADLDRGIEWCEDQLIAANHPPTKQTSLNDYLREILPDQERIAALIENMQRLDVDANQYIIQQGDESDRLFFIESGQVTAQLEKPGQPPVRLETMQGGRVVGELGFFLGARRNATVIVDLPSVIYTLTRNDWERITKDNPEVAQTLNSLIIHLLGQRVSHLTRVVDALQR